MQHIRERAHSQASEDKRRETRLLNQRAAAAIDAQRDRLRQSSIIPSEQARYGMKRARSGTGEADARGGARTPLAPQGHSRLEALAERLRQQCPPRYAVDAWIAYRLKSIELLQPHYPNSAIAYLTLL